MIQQCGKISNLMTDWARNGCNSVRLCLPWHNQSNVIFQSAILPPFPNSNPQSFCIITPFIFYKTSPTTRVSCGKFQQFSNRISFCWEMSAVWIQMSLIKIGWKLVPKTRNNNYGIAFLGSRTEGDNVLGKCIEKIAGKLWRQLITEYLKRLYEGLSRRIQAAIDSQGGYTKY